jgi:serine/threonine-protein kinase HipA
MTYAYNPDGKWTSRHQMTINSKDRNFTLHDLLACAKRMKIKVEDAHIIMGEVRDALMKWDVFASKAYLKKEEIELIKKQFILFE